MHIYIYIYNIQNISLINRLHITYINSIYMYEQQDISHTSLLTFSIRMRVELIFPLTTLLYYHLRDPEFFALFNRLSPSDNYLSNPLIFCLSL
ncbi:hypothetical protein GIB67_039498 [Kingdonia uniflora]|uniref:Uncharacterized protein n=1 Tax=Kingdonia uniflora TaxID=39325 RepID=A0A7J7LJ35_9MAGN|nr:hypothetical protein GIB67_039498 [Kingdonia uniflora]